MVYRTMHRPSKAVQPLLQRCPVAVRMSWASRRETSRLEDAAYCLTGIFNVSMPLIYGEGRKAFLQLQQQIIGKQADASILLWDGKPGSFVHGELSGVLAPSPAVFKRCLDMRGSQQYVDIQIAAQGNNLAGHDQLDDRPPPGQDSIAV